MRAQVWSEHRVISPLNLRWIEWRHKMHLKSINCSMEQWKDQAGYVKVIIINVGSFEDAVCGRCMWRAAALNYIIIKPLRGQVTTARCGADILSHKIWISILFDYPVNLILKSITIYFLGHRVMYVLLCMSVYVCNNLVNHWERRDGRYECIVMDMGCMNFPSLPKVTQLPSAKV